MSVPAVIFDMDGLLLDTEQVCLACFVEARRAFGLGGGAETFLRCVGARGEEPERIIRESLDGVVGLADFDREWDRHVDLALESEVPIKNGVRDLLRILTESGCPLAVATSTSTQRASRLLDTCGLLGSFDCVIGGDQVARHKPDPEVYVMAARRLGRAPQDCVAFEDSATGVRAALASGALTVQIPDLVKPSPETIAMGHLIAPTLLDGARAAGLITSEDLA